MLGFLDWAVKAGGGGLSALLMRSRGSCPRGVTGVQEDASAAGVREAYLLTTTAEHYFPFPRLGFPCWNRYRQPGRPRQSSLLPARHRRW